MRLIKYFFQVICVVLTVNSVAEDAIETTVNNNNKFAWELYSQFETNSNLFFSPYSISNVIAMAYAGANGNTANQIAQVFNFPNQKQLHENLSKLQQQINQKQLNIKLQILNAVCGQQNYNFLVDFKNILKNYYQTELQEVDFATDHENVRNKINSWVETKTTIKKFIKPGILNNFTRLLLVNAIYFNGQWITPFKKATQAPFWLSTRRSVKVPMMKQKGYFSYTSNSIVQILELPYVGEISMIIILPKQSLTKVENLLSKRINKWLSYLRTQQVKVYLPKFKTSTNFDLSNTLAAMGMIDAFNSRADFSGIDGTKKLYLSAVIHQAFIEVNEKGTKATAATGTIFTTRGITPVIPKFRADHPFIFFIRHNPSNSILFMGRVINPNL